MADVKWIKIVTNVFDDEKIRFIETMPNGDAIIVIWFKLLCLCGKSNAGGFLMITDKLAYTDEMLASIFNRDIKVIQMALKTFETLEMIELMDNRIYISNWEKHQSLDKLEAKKLYDREYQRKKREEKKKLLENRTTIVEESNDNRSLDIDKDIDKELETDKDKNNINNTNTIESTSSKKTKPVKHKYGEYQHVLLTDTEKEKLYKDFGETFANDCITYLDEYIEMKGAKYKSHYLAIRKWVVDAVKDKTAKNNRSQYQQRTEIIPDWFKNRDKKEEFKEASQEEIDAFKKTLEELEEPFEVRRDKLKAELQRKYGKGKNND